MEIEESEKLKMYFEKVKSNKDMLEMNEDFVTHYTETVIKQVVARDDEYTKQAIKEYAMQRSQEIGEIIRVEFIDKEIVDKIIELGIKEYIKRKEKNDGKSI